MRLRRLALTIERLLGRPVDVEWAAANRRIFILQARAATRVAPMKSWEDRQVWSNVNTGEVMPDVATPMTWSVIQLLIGPVIRSLFRMMGANADLAPAVGLVAGRVYFNANTGKAAMKPFWFLLRRISNFAQALGGGHVGEYYRDLLEIPDADLPDLGFSWPRYVLSWPRILMDLIRHSPRRGDAWTERVRLQTAELARVDLERMSTAELADFYARMLSLEFEGWDLLYLATQAVALPFFQKACHDWLDDPHLTLGYRLFAGLGGLPEVEAGLALWRLAALAQADELTRAVVTAGEDWPQTRRRLEQTAPGRQFLEAWTGFMTEHGHHCRGELELINVRWCEQPDYILGLLRGYVNSAGRLNPPENQERLARERLQLTEACRRRLRNPVKRWIFQASLKRAQQLAVNREVWKDQAVRRIFILRRLLVLLGHGLSGQGVLGTSDDIFFLETGELHRILQGEATFDVRDCVRRRRLEYEIHRQIPAGPGIVGGCPHGRSATPNPRQNGEEDILKGIPVSPGIVTGRARVILRDNDHEHILPGEILVAPFTDPAWTPYFVTASGVIMEQGGILSHGSIVAREFGLPAVTNVEAVTRRLRTGDLVELDGDRGRVTVLHPG